MNKFEFAAESAMGANKVDRAELLRRAPALRKLAQAAGQTEINDLQQRFNGLGALPKLHKT